MACIRVLIVDNDVLVRENLVAYLEDEGMTVDAVSSGEDALALLRTRPRFDVCVLDASARNGRKRQYQGHPWDCPRNGTAHPHRLGRL